MNPIRKVLVGGGIALATLMGGALGATLLTGAAGAQTSTTAPAGGTAVAKDPSVGGHMANGITETLLTGSVAEQVKAAALAAVPGGTVQRVENDAEGAVYEAHMLDASGNPVTVKLDAAYKVTGTETGGGAGGGRGHGPRPAA